jgi:2-keto-3-deoxy-L-fuconate dehydrogenase
MGLTHMAELSSRLAGKRALITAAAAGIGRASVLRLAAEGAQVIATDIDEAGLGGLAGVARVTTRRLDVTRRAEVEQVAAELGAIDVLFNCAGVVPAGTVLDCTDDAWDQALDVNVTACFRMIRAFLPAMLENGGGSIINMASVVSSLKAAPNRFAYAASKAAVIGITKSVAADFVGRGIRCNAICPGTVDTPSLQARLRATGDYDEARRQFEARQPMGRLAQPEEIAGLVAYLASDDASFVTGHAYPVDGGWAM